MKNIKVTFFNPETYKKRVYTFSFSFDYINHRWIYTLTANINNSTSTHSTYDSPLNVVNHLVECLCKNGEYVTIKIK